MDKLRSLGKFVGVLLAAIGFVAVFLSDLRFQIVAFLHPIRVLGRLGIVVALMLTLLFAAALVQKIFEQISPKRRAAAAQTKIRVQAIQQAALHASYLKTLPSKSTAELIEITMAPNQKKWSEAHVEAARQIIKERCNNHANLPELIDAFEQVGFRSGAK